MDANSKAGRRIAAAILAVWLALLVRLSSSKRSDTSHRPQDIRIGGNYGTGAPNLVPFHTILLQFVGHGIG